MNCVSYLCHVSSGQVGFITAREKISDVIVNPKTDDLIRRKLELIEKARRFAIESLFLNEKGGFVYYTKLDREELGWNVSASYPLKFESYTWWFPVAGNVPYKGFFDFSLAMEEEKKLIDKGFDTRIRVTGGYSTLGWFSDPVFSTQLRNSDDNLAGLVFHEMAHSTVYFQGDSTFNESYASFIEEEGVNSFYKTLEGENSKTLAERDLFRRENSIVMGLIIKTAAKLKTLYDSGLADSVKLLRKNELIVEFKNEVVSNAKEFRKFDQERFMKKKFNNEDFKGALRYNSGTRFFRKKLSELNGNFQLFHSEIGKMKDLSREERNKILGIE